MLAPPSVPSPTVMPAARICGTGATPAASFMLLSGMCDDLGVASGDEGDVLVVDPHAVDEQRAVVEQSQALEVGDR